MKNLFIILLSAIISTTVLAAGPNIEASGIYKVQFVPPKGDTTSYYKAQLILSKDGYVIYRDEENKGLVMASPGCVGTYETSPTTITVKLDCSQVFGPKSITQVWSFDNTGTAVDVKQTQDVILVSSAAGNDPLHFSWERLGDTAF